MTSIPVMRRDHYDADNDGVVDESGASPLSDDDPQALGTAGAGTGSAAARSDHIHAMPNRARGAYDAIVYIQDDELIAEDCDGAEIDSGTAGTDDATIIQVALDSISYGNVYVIGGMVIKSQITMGQKKGIIGNCSMEMTPDTQAPQWLIDTPVGIYVGVGRTGDWQTVRNGYTIENISFRSNTARSNIAIQLDSAQNTRLDKLFFRYFDKAIQAYRIWTSDWGFLHSHQCNYGLYIEPADVADQSADLDIKHFSMCYSYNYNLYCGEYGIKNLNITGGIMESTGPGYGGGVYLAANNKNCRICPTYAMAPAGQYLIYDAGWFNTFDFQSGQSGEILLGYAATLHGNFQGNIGVTTGDTNVTISDARFKDLTGHETVIDIAHAYATLSKISVSTSDSKYQVKISAGGKCIIGDSQFLLNNNSGTYLLADSYALWIAGTTDNDIHDCIIDTDPLQSKSIWGTPDTTWFNYNPIRDVKGFKNRNSNISLKSVDVDSAGVFDVAIGHGLGFYPQIQHCAVTIAKDTDVYDYVAYPVLVSAGTTNVNLKWVVITPSATPGAKAKLALTIT